MQQVSSMGKMQLMPSTHASVHATSVKLIGSKHVGSDWLEHLIQNFKPTPKTREENTYETSNLLIMSNLDQANRMVDVLILFYFSLKHIFTGIHQDNILYWMILAIPITCVLDYELKVRRNYISITAVN